ncbi:hypothetical protein KAW38_02325 [Candidatus Micrarchaeota archaeon]|nr:hypothetical protein [Candidatus Micrarchaeota archaeon]
MVRVITIRDDVYSELSKLKKKKGMSFSLAIEYLLKEKRIKSAGLMDFAGSLSEKEIDRRFLLREKTRWKDG